MVTGLVSTQDRIKSIEAGAEDFISKPFNVEEVLARVRMLLKIKDLNDRLNYAYSNITNLISFGEDVIKSFNPPDFDLASIIDSIVGQNIRYRQDDPQKPRTIVVGIPDREMKWQWFWYDCLSGDLAKRAVDLNIHNMFDFFAIPKSQAAFWDINSPKDAALTPFITELETREGRISNLVYYLSPNLVIFSINHERDVTRYDAQILNNIAMQILFLRALSAQIYETEEAFTYIVYALSRAAEQNDEDTGSHIMRVGEYCALLSRRLGMPEKFIRTIRIQSALHDVGKIHTPAQILKKPGALTKDEWEDIKKHPIYGARIIGDHPRLSVGKNIALTHHEKYDGTGYPYGLKGGQIPLEGRIASVAGQYDAIRNPRVYKPGYDHKRARMTIIEGDGRTMPSHFDPRVINAFTELSKEFEDLYEKMKG